MKDEAKFLSLLILQFLKNYLSIYFYEMSTDKNCME